MERRDNIFLPVVYLSRATLLWIFRYLVEGTHRVKHEGETPIYAAGDAKHGSTLVVNSLADGLACAKEVAADLLK